MYRRSTTRNFSGFARSAKLRSLRPKRKNCASNGVEQNSPCKARGILFDWCRWRDLNPHDLAITSTWGQHDDREFILLTRNPFTLSAKVHQISLMELYLILAKMSMAQFGRFCIIAQKISWQSSACCHIVIWSESGVIFFAAFGIFAQILIFLQFFLPTLLTFTKNVGIIKT